jgi:hypothetical protein
MPYCLKLFHFYKKTFQFLFHFRYIHLIEPVGRKNSRYISKCWEDLVTDIYYHLFP